MEALRLLSEASDVVQQCGHKRPVLVGGAAVELATLGELVSGDLDIVTPWQQIFEEALEDVGFERSVGPGSFSRGFQHTTLKVGVAVVYLLRLDAGHSVSVICIEDLIADRLGQYNSPPHYDEEMLHQAVRLYQLAFELDKPYLDKRIAEETSGDFGLVLLEKHANA